MELNEIITLINAGYSKEEIEAMSKTEAKVPEPKTETEAKPEAKPEKETDPDNEVISYLKSLEAKINGVVDTVDKMQTDNIDKANAGSPEPTPSFEELVANFTKDM